MIKYYAGILFLSMSILSCDKSNPVDNKIMLLEALNGSYTGNIYKWNRDYDSTGVHVIETFDTILNVQSELEIKVADNSITFGGIQYNNHEDLTSLLDKDTIDALVGFSTLPYQSIRIIRTNKFIRVTSSGYAANGGPWAYSIKEEYYKN